MNKALKTHSVPFSAMLMHTIAMREGVVGLLAATQAFHQTCHALAPERETAPSIGAIFRSSCFYMDEALVTVEAVFAHTTQPIPHVLFDDRPIDVARALKYCVFKFLIGFETRKLLNSIVGFTPSNVRVKNSLRAQVVVVMDKVISSLQALALNPANIAKLSLYLREDQYPQQVLPLVKQQLAPYGTSYFSPFILRAPSMALDSFKLEMNGIGLTPQGSNQQLIQSSHQGNSKRSTTDVQAVARQLVLALIRLATLLPQVLQMVLKSLPHPHPPSPDEDELPTFHQLPPLIRAINHPRGGCDTILMKI